MLAIAGLLSAACGSSDDPDVGSGAGSTSSTVQLTGEPVKVMLMADLTVPAGSTPIKVATYKAAVAAVNATGGIKGRPLELDICDSASNPNSTEACARSAVSKKAPAVLSWGFAGGSYVAVLEEAGIADIGNTLSAPLQFTSKVSFPLSAGGAGSVAGFGAIAVQLKCTRLAYIVSTSPAYAAAVKATAENVKKVAEAHKIAVGDLIQAPLGAPDFTPYIANAQQQKADCAIVQGSGADAVGMVKAARQANFSGKLISANAMFPPASVKSLGSLLDGLYADDVVWPASSPGDHKGVQQFVREIETYSSEPSFLSQDELAWAAVKLFAHVANKVETVDAASILAALNQLHDYDPGVAPVVSFDSPPPPGALGPRMFQPNVVIGKFEGGKLVPQGFYNVATAEPVEFR